MTAQDTLNDLARRYYEAQIGGGSQNVYPTLPVNLSGTSSSVLGYNVAALTDRVQVGTASSKRVHSYNIFNPNAAVAYLLLFSAASVGAVTVGITSPLDWIAVPPGGVIDGYWPNSPNFSAGLVIAATTQPMNNATLVPVGLVVSLGYAG